MTQAVETHEFAVAPGHRIELTRTQNAIPGVYAALHLRCGCGWTSSAPDEQLAREIADEHLRTGDPAPSPATVSPD